MGPLNKIFEIIAYYEGNGTPVQEMRTSVSAFSSVLKVARPELGADDDKAKKLTEEWRSGNEVTTLFGLPVKYDTAVPNGSIRFIDGSGMELAELDYLVEVQAQKREQERRQELALKNSTIGAPTMIFNTKNWFEEPKPFVRSTGTLYLHCQLCSGNDDVQHFQLDPSMNPLRLCRGCRETWGKNRTEKAYKLPYSPTPVEAHVCECKKTKPMQDMNSYEMKKQLEVSDAIIRACQEVEQERNVNKEQGELTQRAVNRGAEKHLYVRKPVLDHGHVTLMDYMGTDLSIVGAARISFAKDVDASEADRNGKLIQYLMKNAHTSPFEQAVLTFKLKVPMFIGEQILRHRTARPNKQSGRYSELPEEYYTPSWERIQGQSKTNKQGSAGELPDRARELFLGGQQRINQEAFREYHERIENGVAKELARIDLPASTYTEMVWQIDLHNLLHFLRLRLDGHAQDEIQQYGKAVAEIVKDAFPMTWAAFEEHRLYAVTLSRTEKVVLEGILTDWQDRGIRMSDAEKALMKKLGVIRE